MSYFFNIDLHYRAATLKLGIAALVAVMVLGMWGMGVVSIYFSREAALEKTETDANNFAVAFDDALTHTLDTIDGNMTAVANRMRAEGSDMNIYAWSQEIPIVAGPVIEGGIIMPNGMLVSNTKVPDLKPKNLSARDYFRIQLDGKYKGLFIGTSAESQDYDQMMIPISKRIETKDGRFIGVLVFMLRPAKLTILHQSIDLGDNGTIALVGSDDIIRARFKKNSPDGLDGIGVSIAHNSGPHFNSEISQGSYIKRTATDGIKRVYSYRRIADYPLFVNVGLGYDEGLELWWRNAKTTLTLAAIATLLLGGLALYLMREIDRRALRDIELADERNKLKAVNIELTDERSKLQMANINMAKSMERAEQAENLLIDAVDCISEAFVIFDKDDRFVICNEAYKQLYPHAAPYMRPGTSFEELLCRGLEGGTYKDAIGCEEQWLAERIHSHQKASGSEDQVLSDGRHIMIIQRRMKSGGIAGLRIDITNLAQTREALQKALDKAEAVNQAKTLFLANMSHELRTPLNAIIGFSQIIRDQTLGPAGVPAYAEYAKDIYDSGQHLLEIINNVLDASRIEVGKFDLKEETVEIGELAQSALLAVRIQAGNKSITLEQRLPQEPVGMRADALRLRQVLINLLANAVKFTPEGGRVTLSFKASSEAAVFAVADTGIGMSPDEITAAIEPFRQIENSLVKRHEGVGLGLALAKHMTEMHGGTLEIESEKGVGTTVRVVLPAKRIIRAPKASAAA